MVADMCKVLVRALHGLPARNASTAVNEIVEGAYCALPGPDVSTSHHARPFKCSYESDLVQENGARLL